MFGPYLKLRTDGEIILGIRQSCEFIPKYREIVAGSDVKGQ